MAFTDRLHNRGSISTGYDIDNSLKVQANDGNEWFYRNNPTAGNRRTFTFSFWMKRTQLDGYQADNYLMSQGSNQRFHFAGHTLRFMFDGGSTELEASGRLRDTAAWYHIVIAVDTTQATAANRVKAYVNGETYEWNNTKYPSQNAQSGWMNTSDLYFNTRDGDGSYDNSGYWAEVAVIDGTQYAASDFGEFDSDSGIWKPKDFSEDITFGSEGFYLKFDDATDLGNDSSGNNNDATLNNITSADQATDTPTNNFCTLNPLAVAENGGGNVSITEGGTKGKTLQQDEPAVGTMVVTQGKWYLECQAVTTSDIMAGWGVPGFWGDHTANPGNDDYSFAVHNIGRVYYYGNQFIDFSPSVGFDTTDIVSMALDADNGFCYWAKNGTWMNGGVPTSGSTGTGGFNYLSGSTGTNLKIVDGDFLQPAFRVNYTTNNGIRLNFGGYTTISISSAESDGNGYGTFEYAPPTGFYSMCTKNLAEFG